MLSRTFLTTSLKLALISGLILMLNLPLAGQTGAVLETALVYAEGQPAPARDILTSWIINTTEYAPNIPTVKVNVQSVEQVTIDNVTYVKVVASDMPNYETEITLPHVTFLNTRPLQVDGTPDFENGVPGQSNGTSYLDESDVGTLIAFGEDIGYISSSCGMGYWPNGPDCPGDAELEFYFPLTPSSAATPTEFLSAAEIGVMVNGSMLYNWADAMSYDAGGVWDNVAAKFEYYNT